MDEDSAKFTLKHLASEITRVFDVMGTSKDDVNNQFKDI